jgi:hypothetical protein
MLPSSILSVWRIKRNWNGNDLLIIVNDLVTMLKLPFAISGKRHLAANNGARVGDARGLVARARCGGHSSSTPPAPAAGSRPFRQAE